MDHTDVITAANRVLALLVPTTAIATAQPDTVQEDAVVDRIVHGVKIRKTMNVLAIATDAAMKTMKTALAIATDAAVG